MRAREQVSSRCNDHVTNFPRRRSIRVQWRGSPLKLSSSETIDRILKGNRSGTVGGGGHCSGGPSVPYMILRHHADCLA